MRGDIRLKARVYPCCICQSISSSVGYILFAVLYQRFLSSVSKYICTTRTIVQEYTFQIYLKHVSLNEMKSCVGIN